MTSLFAASVVVLLGGTVVDGTGADARQDSVVEIRDGRIASISGRDGYRAPDGAQVVDVGGRWLVPGLIDTHTHLLDSGSLYTSPDDFDLTARVPHDVVRRGIREAIPATLGRYLCSGVTTVASLGGPRWELDVAASSTAPHVLTAGPFLANFPVGAVTLWTPVDPGLVELKSPAHARETARELQSRGVDLIKVGFGAGPGLTLEDFRPRLEALVEASHALGLRVVMHAEQLDAAKMAVAAGVDVLAHMIVDRGVDDELLDAMLARGVAVITGLSHFDRYREVLDGDVRLLELERRCGDPDVIATFGELADIPASERPPMPAAIAWGSSDEARRILLGNLRRMHDAGIPIAAGSNGGNVGTLQGPSFHRELEAMVRAGLTPGEALRAATRDAAGALGFSDDRGTLEVGKAADVLVLTEDPLESVRALAAIEAVFVSGERVGPD